MSRAAGIALALALWLAGAATAAEFEAVRPDTRLVFPRDFGAHPGYRTEWWYVTGWLDEAAGRGAPSVGFQVTFFRVRTVARQDNPSRFAPEQVIFAHAAVADSRLGRLLHEERINRSALGLAGAAEGDTRVWIDDWSLVRQDGRYAVSVRGREIALDLRFATTAAPLAQGEDGFSRKGPDPRHASHYYSRPQLAVSGRITVAGRERAVHGSAWLDHEWSSGYLPDGAVGWDWCGLNLDGGAAIMAFRMRDASGRPLWAAATWITAEGGVQRFGPAEVAFLPLRRWRSPRSAAEYPVGMRLRIGARELELSPLMDDQELDARAGSGTIYWEGAVTARGQDGASGRGYLELTGYWRPMRM